MRQRGGATIMDSALQQRVELRALWHAHLRNKGRYGSPAARRLLQAAEDNAHSEAERLLIRMLKAAKITGWKANYPVAGYRVDVGIRATEGRHRGRRLRLPQRQRRLPPGPQASERHRLGRLAGAPLHVAGPDGVPGPRHRMRSNVRSGRDFTRPLARYSRRTRQVVQQRLTRDRCRSPDRRTRSEVTLPVRRSGAECRCAYCCASTPPV